MIGYPLVDEGDGPARWGGAMRGRVAVVAVLGAALLAGACVVSLMVMRPGDGDVTTTTASVSTTTAMVDRDRVAVAKVIESLRPGDPQGFAPEAWTDATEPESVLPAGATLRVESDSIVVEGDSATADVVMSTPEDGETRHWVFARRSEGEWLVYGSLELGSDS